MRRRSFTLTSLLVCLLVTSGMPAGSSGARAHLVLPPADSEALQIPVQFAEPTWEPVDGYISLQLDGAPGYVRVAGAPLLPFWGRMLSFPVDTRILEVGLDNATYEEHVLAERILPAPEPVPLVPDAVPTLFEGPAYSDSELYPAQETDFTLTTGMGETGAVEAHLFLKVFPVRYNPVTGLVRELKSATVVVRYQNAPAPEPRANVTYDLLIITPVEFENEMARYQAHKEMLGFSVKMVNLTSLYNGSIFNVSAGRDNPERIKLFIKAALENWTIRYVVLTGDVDKFPVRRAYFADYYTESLDLPTDLYYGDIYKAGTKTFCDWDKDNLFAECYPSTNPDAIDIDPDVTVGRLPVGSEAELRGVVNKTIAYYENVTTGDWFRNVTLVGTDTFGPSRGETSGVAEGEYACDVAYSYLNSSKGFNASRYYEKNGTFSIANIRDCLNRGEGFAIFANHGSTDGVCYPDSGGGPGLSGGTASALTNGPKLPLSVLDACSTHAIDSNDCLGEDLVLNAKGGSIASIGATRVAYGGRSTWHIQGNSGYMNVHLAEQFSKGTIMPGVMLDRTKQSYMANVGIWDYADMKTMCQYIQLGDPVAFIGGAGISSAADEQTIWVNPGEMAQFQISLLNGALHADTVQLTLTGARWAAGLNTSQVTLPVNSTASVTLRVSVDPMADAYESSTVTVNIIPRSTGLPARLNLTTNVNCIRKLAFSVNETRFSAFPGQNVSLGYSLQNDGNVLEDVRLAATGNDAGWKLSKGIDTFRVEKRSLLNGSLSLAVPEKCLAGVYRFELGMTTESGLADAAEFEIVVHKTYGFDARLVNDKAFAGAAGAVFDMAVTNLGNHPDGCELVLLDLPSAWTGQSSYTLQMEAFEQTAQRISVCPDGRALAGDYTMVLRLNCSWGLLQEYNIVATVNQTSSLKFSCADRFRTVDGGSDVDFQLGIASESNFFEKVDLELQRLPVGWGWFLASEPFGIEPFSVASATVVLQVPPGCPAGHYTMDLVAGTPGWKGLSSVSVEVRPQRSFTARLDVAQAVLRPGDRQAFSVTVRNTGNCPDNYLLEAEGALPAYFPRNLMGVGGGSSGGFEFIVTAPGRMRSGDHDLTIRVSSAADPALAKLLVLRVRIEKISDLQLDIEARSGASPGATGIMWLSATNLGSEEETVTLSAPELAAWRLEVPDIKVQPDTTIRVPVVYTVPEGIDGGSYELSLTASNGERSWAVTHQVDVPAPLVNTVSSGSSKASPSLLPVMAGGIVLLVVLAAVALAIRAKRKKHAPASAQPSVPQHSEVPPVQAPPEPAPAPSQNAEAQWSLPAPEPQSPLPPPEPQLPIPPPPPWYQPPVQ